MSSLIGYLNRNMDETVVKTFERHSNRVHIVQRQDGTFTYRKQWLGKDGWGETGPDCGIFGSAEIAEDEARAQVWRLRESI